jgi:hypothetical protein
MNVLRVHAQNKTKQNKIIIFIFNMQTWEVGEGVFRIYTRNLFARLILFKYATSGTVFYVNYLSKTILLRIGFYTLIAYRRGPGVGRGLC